MRKTLLTESHNTNKYEKLFSPLYKIIIIYTLYVSYNCHIHILYIEATHNNIYIYSDGMRRIWSSYSSSEKYKWESYIYNKVWQSLTKDDRISLFLRAAQRLFAYIRGRAMFCQGHSHSPPFCASLLPAAARFLSFATPALHLTVVVVTSVDRAAHCFRRTYIRYTSGISRLFVIRQSIVCRLA